jgi:hypothetical protein
MVLYDVVGPGPRWSQNLWRRRSPPLSAPPAFTEEFLRATLREPVAVVGNGPLTTAGSLIDGFASVIRINRFSTESYEHLCGNKTTHWCVRFHQVLLEGLEHLQPFTPYCRGESRRWKERNDILFCAVPMSRRMKARAPEVSHRRLGFTLDRHVETTGFALTVLLLDLGFRPTLFGFDGLKTGHYFDPGKKHWPGHDKGIQEMEYLRAWDVLYGQDP